MACSWFCTAIRLVTVVPSKLNFVVLKVYVLNKFENNSEKLSMYVKCTELI